MIRIFGVLYVFVNICGIVVTLYSIGSLEFRMRLLLGWCILYQVDCISKSSPKIQRHAVVECFHCTTSYIHKWPTKQFRQIPIILNRFRPINAKRVRLSAEFPVTKCASVRPRIENAFECPADRQQYINTATCRWARVLRLGIIVMSNDI